MKLDRTGPVWSCKLTFIPLYLLCICICKYLFETLSYECYTAYFTVYTRVSVSVGYNLQRLCV